MQNQFTTIKRSELYKKVWSTSLTQLAKEFGISDVALGKTCKKHNIPKPGLGYWAKFEHGKPVQTVALPESKNGDYEITITAFEKPEIRTEDSDPEQISKADELLRKIRSNKESFDILDSLDNAHQLVLRAHRSLKNAPKNEIGILNFRTDKCLPIHVSLDSLNRALIIMDVLLKIAEKYGFAIDSENYDNIIVFGQPIHFNLHEALNREERELTKREEEDKKIFPWRYKHPQYKYIPNGVFSLNILEKDSPSHTRKAWTIQNNQRIVPQIKRFLLTVVELSVHKETEKRKQERLGKERLIEQKRQREILQKKLDEKKRVDQLEREVTLWHKSQDIRAYLSYIQNAAIKKWGTIQEGSELDMWLKWATRRADIVDPLVDIKPELWETDFDRYW